VYRPSTSTPIIIRSALRLMARSATSWSPLKIVNPIIEAGGEIAERARRALENGEIEVLGELMNINHSLLSAVGVSHKLLDKLVAAAREAGALGAKLTGAGGGGCMIALAHRETLGKVASAIKEAGGTAFIAERSDEGVRIEAKR